MVSEIWLSAQLSFARSLFVDMDRAEKHLPLATVAPPQAAPNTPQTQAYEQDLDAFRKALDPWRSATVALDQLPPDPWAAYRSLQGSGFFEPAHDPNPARRGLEMVRGVCTAMIARWWMSDHTALLDLAELLDTAMAGQGLATTDDADRTYLALLLLSQGWITPLRPFFRACLDQYLGHRGPLMIRLTPLSPALRSILGSVRPHSPAVWFSRLSRTTGHARDEQAAIEAFVAGLAADPPRWEFVPEHSP